MLLIGHFVIMMIMYIQVAVREGLHNPTFAGGIVSPNTLPIMMDLLKGSRGNFSNELEGYDGIEEFIDEYPKKCRFSGLTAEAALNLGQIIFRVKVLR